MLITTNRILRQLIFFVVVFLATFVGYLYTQQNMFASTLWPAVGFAAAFYVIYKKQSLLPILLGIFLGALLTRLLFFEESIVKTLFLTSISTISNLIVILIFNKTLGYAKQIDKVTSKNIILWVSACFISPFFGALFAVSIWYIVFPSTSFFTDFFRWSIGDTFGLLIFSSVILLSNIYDSPRVSTRGFLTSFLYILFSAFVSYILFFYHDDTIFHRFSYLYFMLFFTATFFFSFRTIIALNVVFILSFSFNLYYSTDFHNYLNVIFEFNMFLFALSSVASITKIVIYNLQNKNLALVSTNNELDNLVQSTNSILQMSKVFINEESKKDEDLLSQMFEIATKIFHNFDYATCYLMQDGKIHFVNVVGYDKDFLNRLDFNPSTFVFDKNKIEMVDQKVFGRQIEQEIPKTIEEYYKEFPKIKSSIRFGIFLSDSVVGGMSFDQSVHFKDDFSKYDLENFDSFQKLMNGFYEINYLSTQNDKLKNDLVLSLVRTLELYDDYTGGHSEDVANLSLEIAKRLDLGKKEQYDIYWAGVVHDIGKVGVDVSIINKKGKLTPTEFNEVKKHALHGYNILNRSEDLRRIALWVRNHHEWWNGQGYPDHLKADEIPIGSQILCVADAVSSMATVRSYSDEKSPSAIKEELILFKAVQFSPEICNIMIEMIDDGFIDEYFNKR